MTPVPYDVILAGGGLANALIAWRLQATRPSLRILLLEGADKVGGNHTWSFHESDLDPAQRQWLAPMISARWPGYDVIFPEHARTLDGGYASISSADFARVIESALGAALRTNAQIEKLSPTT
ncbi:MAG TPA: lycopene cyclase family protein, partial [Duganella sp.]